MAKKAVRNTGGLQTVKEDIENDEEVLSTGQDIQGDVNDIINLVDDKDYVKALEELDDMQEKIDSIHVYLTNKAKG